MDHHILSASSLSHAWACRTTSVADDIPPVAADVLITGDTRLIRREVSRSVDVPRSLTLIMGDALPDGVKASATKAVLSESAAAFYFLASGASPAAAAADRLAAARSFGRAAVAAGSDVFAFMGSASKIELADRLAAELVGTGVSVRGDELVEDVPLVQAV